MVEKSKYGSDVMKKYFNKKLVMTKEDDEDFENSTKSWICDNVYVDCDVKLRHHCYITENIETLHIEIVISTLNLMIKLLLYFTT